MTRSSMPLRPSIPDAKPISLRRAWQGMAAALLAAAALTVACGKKTATGPPPVDHLPPSVIETVPAARATRVSLGTMVWARFREPLDPATVSGTTVFLKVDTRRIPMTVTLEDSAREVVIRPHAELDPRRTHTVEFSPQVRTAAGASFAETYFWQFTTISVRRPAIPEPADRVTDESPVTPLFWNGTEETAGPVEYRVFHGPDSVQVAAETSPVLVLSTPFHLPSTLWERGSTVFWKVQAHNVETGDDEAGPVWRFDVVPAGAPIDSIFIVPRDTGYWDDQFRVWRCPNLASGTRADGLIRFNFDLLDSNLVIADAIVAIATTTNVTAVHNAQLWSLVRDQAPCDARLPGFPQSPATGLLGRGVRGADTRVRFASASLASQVQARIRRHREFVGYVLRSQVNITYTPDNESGLRVYYFRPGSRAAMSRNRGR